MHWKSDFSGILIVWQLLIAIHLVYATYDPSYVGIKTKTYQREPIIVEAYVQQRREPYYTNANFQHSHNTYQSANVDEGQRLSPMNRYNSNHNNYENNNNNDGGGGGVVDYQHQQYQQQGDYYQHQQELPLYDRNSHDSHVIQTNPAWSSVTGTAILNSNEYYTDCPSGHTGQLPYAYDCHKFLNCWEGNGPIQSCTADTVFNPKTLQCDRPDNVVCGTLTALGEQALTKTQTQSHRQSSGRLIDISTDTVKVQLCPPGVTGLQPHPHDCKKFLNCANGNVHIQDCGPGTAYSVSKMVCDHEHLVDCSGRSGTDGNLAIRQQHQTQNLDYGNRDGKSYSGWSGNQNAQNQWHSQGSLNRDDTINQQHYVHSQNQNQHQYQQESQQSGYTDRWTNMNRQRPNPINDQKSGQNSGAWSSATTNSQYNQNIQKVQSESEPSWSGSGSSLYRQAPNESIIIEEGSLRPENRYFDSVQLFNTPLAPFPSKTLAENFTKTATTTTHTYANANANSKTNTNTIVYAQPVGSQEDSEETFNTVTSFKKPIFNVHAHEGRQNFSREINQYGGNNNYNNNNNNRWIPIPSANPRSTYTPSLPNEQIQAPYSGSVFTTNSIHKMPTPSPLLLPPYRTPEESAVQINKKQSSALDQESSGTNSHSLTSTTQTHSTHINTNIMDQSNLFGGLKPPLPTIPADTNTTPQLYLKPPTQSTASYDSNNGNVHAYPLQADISNVAVHNYSSDPHYSNPYSAVAHSRNTTWTSVVDRQLPTYTVKITNPTIQSDQRIVGTPPSYNKQYYKSTNSELDVQENDGNNNLQKLPISEALRMLLRPYFNRSGTVTEDVAGQAESHIMSVVTQTNTTTTTKLTSALPTQATLQQQQQQNEKDVELILAGEQNHLITKPTITHNYDGNSKDLDPNLKPTGWHHNQHHNYHHDHNREFHLRHPNIPNPFTEDERSRTTPNDLPNNHNHDLHKPGHEHQHSRDFHLRHPHLPNPFAKNNDDSDDKLNTEGEDIDLPNPNAEFTTPMTTIFGFNPRINLESDCSFKCDNGKCITSKQVCDGVNNCGNRKDESSCDHLGYKVRLTGGEHKHMGRLEVNILGKWGYVCDDKFGLRDADVVCRELGFKLGASEVRGSSFYPSEKSNFSIMMDEVDCRGNETSLKDCDFKGWGVNNCGPDEIVGVVCKVPLLKCPDNLWLCSTSKECIPPAFVCDNTPDCADGSDESDKTCNAPIQYRLEGGRNDLEGRVEVLYRGIWGTVCDDDFGLKEAQVFCNSKGYYGKPKIEKNIYGPGSGPIWLYQVSCLGNETSIDKCSHWPFGEHNCNHTEDLGIKCTIGPPPRRSTTNHYVPTTLNTKATNGFYNINNNNDDQELEGQTLLEQIGLYPVNVERSSKSLGNQRRCGQYKRKLYDEYAHPEERVVNASVAKRGRHPWQATIRTRGTSGISSHWCGAVLISRKHLLTAAHCLAGYAKGAYFVRMGDHYANIAESSEIDSYIENWYIHEKFRDKTHMNNDIALIVLKHPVRFNDYIQPICLPEKGAYLQESRMCTISGWGSIKSGVSTPSNILRAAELPILPFAQCNQTHVYGDAMTDSMFCAGSMDESVDACDGDSGGPLVCGDEGGETLYGIISWGKHCGYANKPGVYVKVGKFIDWIYEKINASMQKTKRNQ